MSEQGAAAEVRWASAGVGVAAAILGLAQLASDPTGRGWWVVVVSFLLATVCLVVARAELVRHPAWAVAIAIVYIVAAGTALLVATRQHLLWESLIALVVAAVVGVVAMMVLIDLGRKVDLARRITGAWVGILVGVGVGMIVWGMLDGNRLLAFEGFAVAGLGLVAATVWLRGRGDAHATLLLGGGAALLQAVVLLQGTRSLNLALGTGLVLWVAGISVVKLALRPWIREATSRAAWATAASVAATVAGGVVAFVGTRVSNAFALVGGVTLLIVGLSAFGIAVVWVGLPRPVAFTATGAGIVLIAVGVVDMAQAARVWGIALLVGLVLVLIGAWFVLRGEGLMAMVLAALLVLWGMGDRTEPLESDPNPTAASRLLALGDSFISGEGAQEYFAGTNQVGGDRNECRRARTAYPYLVAAALRMGLDSFACSGARTVHLLSEGQMPDSADGVAGALPQLANLDRFTTSQIESIDVVLVSIGGNDVGFSTIVKACLLPRDCDERRQDWFANVKQLRPQLVTTYEAIKAKVPNTPIIAMPYPEVTGSTACGLGLQDAEHRFVVEFIRRLNNQIRSATQEAGIHFFDEGIYVFGENGLCASEPATNHLDLSPPEGHWLARYSPGSWVHGSMHPNPLGHSLTAEAVVDDVRRVTAAAAEVVVAGRAELAARLAAGEVLVLPPDVDPGADPAVVAGLLTVGELSVALGRDLSGNPEPRAPEDLIVDEPTAQEVRDANQAQEALTDNEWIHRELFRTAGAFLLPSIALVIGAILATAGLVMLRPQFSTALSPKVVRASVAAGPPPPTGADD